jgi:hypothetical protein
LPLGLLENCDLRLKSLSHRKVGIKFTKGSGNLRDPINVLAEGEVGVHALLIERPGDGNVASWSFFLTGHGSPSGRHQHR